MFLCASTSLVGVVFTFFCIPRTKDKSMYELEMLFVKKRGNEGNMISGFDLIDKAPLSTGSLYPKFQVQTSGIIQKLYETKPDTNKWFSISIN